MQDMHSIQLMVDWWFGGFGFKSGYPLRSWLDITGGIFQGTRGLGPETLTETWQPKVFKTELPFFWGEIKKVHMVKIQISNDQNLPPSQKKHKLFSARGASVGKNGHGSKADLCIWQGAS